MRILILTNRVPYPLHDGGALAMDAMIRGYKMEGLEVYVLAMNTSRHPVEDVVLERLYKDIDGFYTVAIANDLKRQAMLKNFLFSREPEHAVRFQSAAFDVRLRQLLQAVSPDVVQLESPFLTSYIPSILAASKALLVYRMHNVEGQIWVRLAAESRGLKRFYLRNLAKRMARYEARLWRDADLLLPITNTDAEAIKSAGIATPMLVAPFGIKTSAEGPPSPKGFFKTYHIGAMDWLPNAAAVRWFIEEVWPSLHQWAPEVTFHFAGRAMPDAFKTGLPEGVYCAGEVANAAAFIEEEQVLVVPLRAGGGVRIKILEAMAAGKLVVSTSMGMQGIDAQPELHYLNADSAQDFAHLIAWASAHREKAQSIAQSGQELVRNAYDERRIIARIVDKIQSLLS